MSQQKTLSEILKILEKKGNETEIYINGDKFSLNSTLNEYLKQWLFHNYQCRPHDPLKIFLLKVVSTISEKKIYHLSEFYKELTSFSGNIIERRKIYYHSEKHLTSFLGNKPQDLLSSGVFSGFTDLTSGSGSLSAEVSDTETENTLLTDLQSDNGR